MPASVDHPYRGEVDPRLQRGAEVHARQGVALGLIGEELDGASLVRHGDDELVVHHQASLLRRLKMDAGGQTENQSQLCRILTCFSNILATKCRHVDTSSCDATGRC